MREFCTLGSVAGLAGNCQFYATVEINRNELIDRRRQRQEEGMNYDRTKTDRNASHEGF